MPLVNFLEKKEAYFLDKQKQGIIYIGGEPHPPNHSKLMDLDLSFCSRLIKSHTHSCQKGPTLCVKDGKTRGLDISIYTTQQKLEVPGILRMKQ